MDKHRQEQKQYSLKDELFNYTKVAGLAAEIEAVYTAFPREEFVSAVVADFPEQELMQRVRGIRDHLRAFLPPSYPVALAIILAALPPPLDPKKTDNDFGDFIYAPYAYFVATYGCTEKHVERSLVALREITKRFTAEGALRDFLNAFPQTTIKAVEAWSRDPNYHVRRLASEGTRPNLPWAKRIALPPQTFLPLLDTLHADPTRYVVRSVANHLNDVSKLDKRAVIKLLKKWNTEKRQSSRERAYLTNHALRTLVRAGDSDALRLIGYAADRLTVGRFALKRKTVAVGESLVFSFTLTSTSHTAQNVMVDYLVYYKKANGTLAPKTYKIVKTTLAPGETIKLEKVHPLRLMSTRTLYTGVHAIGLQINGKRFGKRRFTLV